VPLAWPVPHRSLTSSTLFPSMRKDVFREKRSRNPEGEAGQ
jgi:hypothetical protein